MEGEGRRIVWVGYQERGGGPVEKKWGRMGDVAGLVPSGMKKGRPLQGRGVTGSAVTQNGVPPAKRVAQHHGRGGGAVA